MGRFVDREITPRFPDGLTVLQPVGQWRDQQQQQDRARAEQDRA